jgi:hypothetical protein
LQLPAAKHPGCAVTGAVYLDVGEPMRRRRGAEGVLAALGAGLDSDLAVGQGEFGPFFAHDEHKPRVEVGTGGCRGDGRCIAPRE